MRFPLASLCLSLAMCAVAAAQNVTITWVGHSCFVIQADGGPTVLIDPVPPAAGYSIPPIPADVVTISHNHGDHTFTAGVAGNFTLVDGRTVTTRSQMTAANLPFVLIPAFHDEQNGAVSPNTIIQWTQGGMRFAQLGDIGQAALTSAQLADLQNLDVVFIPSGGFFTIDAQQAAAFASQIGARVAILEHYQTALGGPLQVASLPNAASGAVVYQPSTVVLNRASLPASPQIWVMQPLSSAVVVNAASFAPGVPVAPGSLAAVFGKFTGSGTLAAPDLSQLPRQLGQTQVLFQGSPAPLLYVSPSQIDFQVPSVLSDGTVVRPGQFLVQVQIGGNTVATAPATVVTRAPGLFIVLNPDGSLNSASRPAHRGDAIQIYATGHGGAPFSGPQPYSQIADGTAFPPATVNNPQFLTRTMPQVSVGGQAATVTFSGLLVGVVGGWKIQAVIPSNAPTGATVPLSVTERVGGPTVGSLTSNTLMVAIQ